MIRWHLVRHGRTEFNRDGRIQGHTQVALDEEGLSQARKLRDRLAGETFVAAWSSDLLRTQQMAKTILDGRNVVPVSFPELRELSYGQWEGLTVSAIRERYDADFSRIMSGHHDSAPPGGESVTHLLERTGRFVQQMKRQVAEGNVLVVCHGGSLRGLVVNLMGLPAATFWSLKVDLASLSIIEVYPNRPVLALFNDTSHLKCTMGPST